MGQERTRSRPGAHQEEPGAQQEWARSVPGLGQWRTRSGPGARQGWAGSAPGLGQEVTRSGPRRARQELASADVAFRKTRLNSPYSFRVVSV